jgi:TetR/AcrR family transcriptional regulator
MADRGAASTLEKETLILDAAQRRFASYGLNKVTMDEIAADIGMGKASLYYYFPNKDELFRAVISREQQAFLRRLGEVGALDAAASAKLRMFTELQLEFFMELMNLQLVSLQTWLHSRPLFRELKEALQDAEQRQLAEILKAGVAAGEFGPIAIEPCAAAIVHALQGLRLRVLRAAELHPDAAIPPQALAADIRVLLDLILNGLCCRTGPGTQERFRG